MKIEFLDFIIKILEKVYDGQFDWGGRLLKSNGGVQW